MSEIDRLYQYKTLLSSRRVMSREDILNKLEISLATFERTWARGEHWAMVALPADQLPATAEATPMAAAIAALELRDRTGVTVHLDLSMQDVTIWMTQIAPTNKRIT